MPPPSAGFNVFQFNPDDSVDVTPLRLDFKRRLNLESHLLVFFTGITRLASDVLKEQKEGTRRHSKTLQQMADSVLNSATGCWRTTCRAWDVCSTRAG